MLKDLRIVEQQVPGKLASGEEDEARGLPDACVFTDDGWAVLFEAKVQAGTGVPQLIRHRRTAERHAYKSVALVIVAVDAAPAKMPSDMIAVEWRQIFAWMSRHERESTWARWFTEYLEVFESKMIARNYGIRGTLTMFKGLDFDDEHPYTYREAKRLIRLLRDDLQERRDLERLGMDPAAAGRPAITGSGAGRVWDIIPLKSARGTAAFTSHPHLTIDIGVYGASAAITIPHGVKGGFRNQLRSVGESQFRDLLLEVERSLRPVINRSPGAKPIAYIMQRHYPSQRSTPILDGEMRVDLRALVSSPRSAVRYQPEWASALFGVLAHKKSNIQFGLSVNFKYGCPVLGSSKAGDLFAQSWLAMKPLLAFVLDA